MKFSVLMSVYAGEQAAYLQQSLHSIWTDQTLRPDQIVLVQDGPLTEPLYAVILHWKEQLGPLLDLVVLSENRGLSQALNAGLSACRFELVARMDTDDVAMPDRFAKQVAFMLAHPEIAASSAALVEYSDDLTTEISRRDLPLEQPALTRFARYRSPLSHPLAMFRKSVIISVGGYPPLRKAQDYALWSLLLVQGYQLANLAETLLKMRAGQALYQRRGFSYLRYEWQLLSFQRKIGFLSLHHFLAAVTLRTLVRLLPAKLKAVAYRSLRPQKHAP